MTSPERAPALRADAARNVDRLVAAGRSVLGARPEASLEEVARCAGVSPATLYRRFATKDELVRCCLEKTFHAEIEPALAVLAEAADPWEGLQQALRSVLETMERSQSLVSAAQQRAAVLAALRPALYASLGAALERAQGQGSVRADVAPGDLPHLVAMVVAVMGPDAADDTDWHRYLEIVLRGLEARPGSPTAAGSPSPAGRSGGPGR